LVGEQRSGKHSAVGSSEVRTWDGRRGGDGNWSGRAVFMSSSKFGPFFKVSVQSTRLLFPSLKLMIRSAHDA
jgi:hypothetical protein